MSWRHSQPRAQSRRRTLERCKGKGITENVVLIDLDNGNFHNIIMVDASESSQQRPQRPSVTGKDKTLPSSSIISIDDEESGDDDNPENGDEEGFGDGDRHATSGKTYNPSSDQSRDSEELDDNECQFIQERKFPLKLSKCKRTYSRKTLPRNRFALNPVSDSSSSESDSSDCELMDGSSGKIRELWEKAASRKKLFTDVLNGQVGLEDQVSASGSNSDTPKTVEVENTAEQHAEVSVCSSPSNSNAEKEDPSTSAATLDGIMEDPSFKHVENDPVADLDQTSDQDGPSWCKTQSCDKARFSHGKVGVQDRGKAFPGEPSFCRTESSSDSGVNRGGANFQDEEEQDPGRHFCFTHKEGERQFNYGRSCFQDSEENIEECSYINTQPGTKMQASSDRVVSWDKNERISGEPSFHNIHSPNDREYERASFEDKEKPSSGEPSFCRTESGSDSGVNHGGASLRDRENQVPGRPFYFSPVDGERQFNYGRSCFQEKEENIGECFLNTQPGHHDTHLNNAKASFQDEGVPFGNTQELYETQVVFSWDKNEGNSSGPSSHKTHAPNGEEYERASFKGKEKPSSGEPCLFGTRSCDETGVKDCATCSEGKDEPVLCESFSRTTQSWDGTEVSDERVSQQDNDKSLSREQSLCNVQPDETQLNHGRGRFKDEEKADLGSLCSTQPHDETSPLIHAQDGNGAPNIQNDIIGEREKLKETDEYKRAAEEEWLSRQQQLRIQAEEARRLRKRKKAETLRLLDMERRQKQRVEEMRETKKKDEEALNLKEQLRVEVRKELDKLEMKYTDMASLLQGLGIHVGDGCYPMPREVHAAYKQALLRFHPDRASRTDIRQQVEAEEKFKLVSRLKDKLLPSL